MALAVDVGLTALSTLGLGFLFWWLVGRLIRPISTSAARIVIPGRGNGEELELTVRGFIWLRSLGMITCPLLIADAGMTPTGRDIAQRLAARWPEVILCPIDRLEETL